MRLSTLHWRIPSAFHVLMLATTLAIAQVPPLPPPPPPPPLATLPRVDPTSMAGADMADKAISNALSEIRVHYEHYGAQAQRYERAALLMRVSVLVFSVLSAVVLALSSSDWSRRAALVLSLFAAAVPAADQIFQLSEMHRASWRAAVDASRLFGTCQENWELKAAAVRQEQRESAAHTAASDCRKKLFAIVDAEMETSMKPLQLQTKVEAN